MNIATGHWNILFATPATLTAALQNGTPVSGTSLDGFQGALSPLVDQLAGDPDVSPATVEQLAAAGLKLEAFRQVEHRRGVKTPLIRKSLRGIAALLQEIPRDQYTRAVRQATLAGEYAFGLSTTIYWSTLLGRPDSLSRVVQDRSFHAGFVGLHTASYFQGALIDLMKALEGTGYSPLILSTLGLRLGEAIQRTDDRSEANIRRLLKNIGVNLAQFPETSYLEAIAQLRSLGGAWYFAPLRWVTAPATAAPQTMPAPRLVSMNSEGRLFGKTASEGIWDRMRREDPELYELVQRASAPDGLTSALEEIALTEIGRSPHLSSAAIRYLIQAVFVFVLEYPSSIDTLFELLRTRSSIFQREHAELLQQIAPKITSSPIRERYLEFQRALRTATPELFAGDSAA